MSFFFFFCHCIVLLMKYLHGRLPQPQPVPNRTIAYYFNSRRVLDNSTSAVRSVPTLSRTHSLTCHAFHVETPSRASGNIVKRREQCKFTNNNTLIKTSCSSFKE